MIPRSAPDRAPGSRPRAAPQRSLAAPAAALLLAALLLLSCGETPSDPESAAATPSTSPSPATLPDPGTGEARAEDGGIEDGGAEAGTEVFDWPQNEIRPGGEIEGRLEPGETHRIRLALDAGQLLELTVEQHGVDLFAALEDPQGAELLYVDRPIDDLGNERALAITRTGGSHALVLGTFPGSGPGAYRARIEALRPAAPADEELAAAYREYAEAVKSKGPRYAERLAEALGIWRRLEDAELEGEALHRLALIELDSGTRQRLLADSAEALARAGDRRWAAYVRANLAGELLNLDEIEAAREEYRRALEPARSSGDRTLEARVLHGLGQAQDFQGEVQEALDLYGRALELWPPREPKRTYTVHNLGVLHLVHLGDLETARPLLEEARDAWRPVAHEQRLKATTLAQLGQLAFDQERFEDARSSYLEALDLYGEGAPCSRAVLMTRLARVLARQGDASGATDRIEEALAVLDDQSCPIRESTVLRRVAELQLERGELSAALASFRRAAELYGERGDDLLLATSLGGMAEVERRRGDLDAALALSARALELIEAARVQILREDLRTSFFATVQGQFERHVELLVAAGEAERSWEIAERARSRALRDLLAEAGAGLRRAADPRLVARERELQRRLNALDRRLDTVDDLERRSELEARLAAAIDELETVRGEVRRRDPRYAALTRPSAVEAETLRRELLDRDTLLLEYRLGEASSHLWAVDAQGVRVFELPARERVESLVREAAGRLESLDWPESTPRALCELADLLLAPVAGDLDDRRLVLVPDGALEALSFAALPDPAAADCASAPPLVAEHELVYLPSATTLALQRSLLADRAPAESWLAMIADPVYGPEDPRWSESREAQSDGLRGAGATARAFERLPQAGREAEAILSLLPAEKTFAATGFDASQATVTSGALDGHRIVHFAVHGVLDADDPLLSYLALSQLDRDGKPLAGELFAHRVYDLDLAADLVVLSACETALGEHVAGEGLIAGLPRAFLYAGAARVLVSLWAVPDRGTRELMQRFYRALLVDGLAPAEALRRAQLSLWREGHPPYRWAGFVLQGDWRPLLPFGE